MDLVYVLGTGSNCDNLELRYSLRSMEKHLQGIDNVYIIGEDPGFLKDIIHIHFPDMHGHNQARNIYEKILRACQEESLSDHFLYCSDDIYLTKDYNALTFPYYYCSTLPEMVSTLSKESSYKVYVENTLKALTDKNLPTVYFNGHSPIVYHKEIFQTVMTEYDWNTRKGYIAKSLYANTLKIPGEYMKDTKFHTPKTKSAIYRMLKDVSIFSTDLEAINAEMMEALQELWPMASRREV